MSQRSGRAAFTLVEILTAMGVFSLVTIAIVASHVVGLKMFNIAATKLSASAQARMAMNAVRDDIRSAKTLYVGNGDNTGFTNVSGAGIREGSALQIYPAAGTNVYTRYYVDAGLQKLMRVSAGSTQAVAVASFLTNTVAFRGEDYAGNGLTSDQNNRIIRMTLDFYQWEFPVAQAGTGGYYDYYRLQTRFTRRTIE